MTKLTRIKLIKFLTVTVWKVSKYGVFSGLYYPAFGLNTERYALSVLSPNAGKYGTRKTSVFEHFSRSVWYTSSSDSFSLMSHFLRVFYKSISSPHFILTTYCNNIWNLTASVIIGRELPELKKHLSLLLLLLLPLLFTNT